MVGAGGKDRGGRERQGPEGKTGAGGKDRGLKDKTGVGGKDRGPEGKTGIGVKDRGPEDKTGGWRVGLKNEGLRLKKGHQLNWVCITPPRIIPTPKNSKGTTEVNQSSPCYFTLSNQAVSSLSNQNTAFFAKAD